MAHFESLPYSVKKSEWSSKETTLVEPRVVTVVVVMGHPLSLPVVLVLFGLGFSFQQSCQVKIIIVAHFTE